MIAKDYKGHALKAGTLVAFNYSGEVRIGEILEVKERAYPKRYPEYLKHEPLFTFIVEHAYTDNLRSKITSVRNLCSLNSLLE